MGLEMSNVITRLQKEGTSVIHSGRRFAQRASDALSERFGGSPPVDFLGLQLGLVDLVETELAQLFATDATYVRGVVDNRLQVQERDAAFAEAFGVLSGVRSAVEGVYGGLGEKAWRNKFAYVNSMLDNIRRRREHFPDEYSEFASQLEEVEEYWENQLDELELKASRAGVPRAWRE